MKQFASLLITIFILVACQSQADATQTILANTLTSEITLTSTPQPTTLPQATATQPLSIEFPDWVKNPDTQILLVPVGTQKDGYENMALINAETGERFDIPFTEKGIKYFWMPDGSKFGFISKSKNQAILFSIKDGLVTTITLHDGALNFFQDTSNDISASPVQLLSSNITDPNFLILPSWFSLSSDKRYFIYQENCNEIFFCIFDIESNKTINIFEFKDDTYYLFSELSPNSKFLGVVEVDEQPGIYYTFQHRPTFRLKIYDIHSQQLFASYKNITSANWSPDGAKFLYTTPSSSEYYSFLGGPPCIFDTITGETKCYQIYGSAYPSWSPNQAMVGFIGSYNKSKGFCTIKLSTEEIKCILENLETEEQMPINYLWSGDSKYILFTYDDGCPYCDYSNDPQLGIANIQTGEYFSIGTKVIYSNLGLWRPSPNP